MTMTLSVGGGGGGGSSSSGGGDDDIAAALNACEAHRTTSRIIKYTLRSVVRVPR